MSRQGTREIVLEMFLYALPVYVHFYQALLLYGMSKALLYLLLAVLLLFLVAHKGEIGRALSAGLRALSKLWIAPTRPSQLRELLARIVVLPQSPEVHPLFQRPPPLFA